MVILWDSSILNLYLCIQLLWFHFVQTSRWWSFEKKASSVFLCYCTFHSTVSSLFHKIIRVSSSLSLSYGFGNVSRIAHCDVLDSSKWLFVKVYTTRVTSSWFLLACSCFQFVFYKILNSTGMRMVKRVLDALGY
jgi:hypothetical protein